MATYSTGNYGTGTYDGVAVATSRGSTPPYEVTYSLNVLAGTLTANGAPKYGAAQAAALYAGITSPPWPEVVDSLNRAANNKLPNYQEMNGVCNQLAGTTGLDAQDALSRLAGN